MKSAPSAFRFRVLDIYKNDFYNKVDPCGEVHPITKVWELG